MSRRLVVEAYAQLLAEGYLAARGGSGTYVAQTGAQQAPATERPRQHPLSFDFFPGNPDLATFPRRAWLRAQRAVLAGAPDAAFGYPDPRGALELRAAVAGHLRRVRGVVADPESIVVCAGAAEGFALLARALGDCCVAVEDPGMPVHRAILAANGATPVALAVDGEGARVEDLARLHAEWRIAAALLTPSHQSPTGVALSRARRASLLAWAAAERALVIEDDYDAEFRYDRAPLGALQGLAPDSVVYVGTASKSLAPCLRLGWLVLPGRLLERVVEQKVLAGSSPATLEQLALARMIECGDYDRHLRQARRRYRARRDALVAAVAQHLPGARVTGLAAGLHAIVELGDEVDALALVHAALARSVGVYPLAYAYVEPRARDARGVLGYANLAEPAIDEGIRRLADALAEPLPNPPPTNDGGAIAR